MGERRVANKLGNKRNGNKVSSKRPPPQRHNVIASNNANVNNVFNVNVNHKRKKKTRCNPTSRVNGHQTFQTTGNVTHQSVMSVNAGQYGINKSQQQRYSCNNVGNVAITGRNKWVNPSGSKRPTTANVRHNANQTCSTSNNVWNNNKIANNNVTSTTRSA